MQTNHIWNTFRNIYVACASHQVGAFRHMRARHLSLVRPALQQQSLPNGHRPQQHLQSCCLFLQVLLCAIPDILAVAAPTRRKEILKPESHL